MPDTQSLSTSGPANSVATRRNRRERLAQEAYISRRNAELGGAPIARHPCQSRKGVQYDFGLL
jgi:hypothetical protein